MPNEEQTSFYKELFAKHFTGFKELKPGAGREKEAGNEKKIGKGSAAKKTAAMQTIKRADAEKPCFEVSE